LQTKIHHCILPDFLDAINVNLRYNDASEVFGYPFFSCTELETLQGRLKNREKVRSLLFATYGQCIEALLKSSFTLERKSAGRKKVGAPPCLFSLDFGCFLPVLDVQHRTSRLHHSQLILSSSVMTSSTRPPIEP
jgi:hypothetical protein